MISWSVQTKKKDEEGRQATHTQTDMSTRAGCSTGMAGCCLNSNSGIRIMGQRQWKRDACLSSPCFPMVEKGVPTGGGGGLAKPPLFLDWKPRSGAYLMHHGSFAVVAKAAAGGVDGDAEEEVVGPPSSGTSKRAAGNKGKGNSPVVVRGRTREGDRTLKKRAKGSTKGVVDDTASGARANRGGGAPTRSVSVTQNQRGGGGGGGNASYIVQERSGDVLGRMHPVEEQPDGTTTASNNNNSNNKNDDNDSNSNGTSEEVDGAELDSVKARLLAMISPLDRGRDATVEEARRVAETVEQLENISPRAVQIYRREEEEEMLSGTWKLLYSSELVQGNVQNPRNAVQPGQGPLLPFELGPVEQVIDTKNKRLDNVVQLQLKLTMAPLIGAASPKLVARLGHTYEILGARTVKITYDATTVKAQGGLADWLDALPEFSTPSFLNVLDDSFRSATFDVLFVDQNMRVTRGDRGEYRVFLKV